MSDKDFNWYLAQLKPNGSQIAARNLAQQGFTAFYPKDKETQRRAGRFVTRYRPVFPGYIFVALDVAQGAWRAVNATRGITRLVSFGTEPATVPSGLVADLRDRYDRPDQALTSVAPKSGDRVRVTTGPFAGFLAEIETIAPDRRVWVLMDILGKQTRVATKMGHVRPV